MFRFFICAIAVFLATPSAAGSFHANPRTLNAVFARTGPGDEVVLAPGDYGGISLANRTFSPALTLRADKARIIGLRLRSVDGLVIRGGEFGLPAPVNHPRTGLPVYGAAVRMDDVRNIAVLDARMLGPGGTQEGSPYGEGYGVFVVRGAGVTVEGGVFRGFKSGVVLSRVEGFRLVRNAFTYMRSDGIQVGESRKGLIEANSCADTRIRDKEHPDCIQLWSRPTSPPTADVTIRGNRAKGDTQGIGLFNVIRNGVDDGGFDRILIEDNDVLGGHPHGIALMSGRDSIVRNNRVDTIPGSRWRAGINLVGGDVVRCGNRVAAASGRPGVTDKSCPAN